MKKLLLKALSLCLVVLMILSLAACGGEEETVSSETSSKAVSSKVSSSDKRVYRDIPFEKGDIVTPAIVETKYATEDVVVADHVVTNSYFAADPTGVTDSTEAIQYWLNVAAFNGGGTVWMPAGTYRITSSITVPAFVTLRGDWQDPDEGSGYGTVIIADVKATTADSATGTFYLKGSGGVYGLTVFYPGQSMSSIKCYPFTFYVDGIDDGYMLQSIINCTVINGYKGIGACVSGENAHEMLTVENFKGTFLGCGVEVYNQADVGTWKNVSISNKYWAEAKGDYKCQDTAALKKHVKDNVTGLILGDLEWTEFENLSVKDCNIGINVVKGKRIEFAGSLNNVSISNCTDGIVIDTMDDRWGMLLSKSTVTADENALVNNSGGEVRAIDVTFNGKVTGTVKKSKTSLSKVNVTVNRKPVTPKAVLYVPENLPVNKPMEDAAPAINAALQAAAAAGGGIVYVPAGIYRLNTALSVPTGVELRGSGSVAQRDQTTSSKGTVFLTNYGSEGITADTQDKAAALITLSGGAGIRNIRVCYLNAVGYINQGSYQPGAYTVRGTGSDVYAVNVCIAGAVNGIDFRGCDKHLIKKYVSYCLENAMAVGGKNGVVEGCLQNGTVLDRSAIKTYIGTIEGDSFDKLFNAMSRLTTTYIKVEKAEGQSILNTFCYGAATFLSSANSSCTAINIGADNLGTNTPMVSVTKGSMTVVNMMRYNGLSYENNGGKVKFYNRLTIAQKEEEQNATK